MILTPAIKKQVMAACRRDKKKAVVLPDFCYWEGRDQPVVYVDNLPENLSRVLYRELIGPLEYGQVLQLKPGVHERNVNPFLFEIVAKRTRGTVCPNGHTYAGNEMPENKGRWRCRTCYETWLAGHRKGSPSVADINRSKEECPNHHPYSGENLIILGNGRRRCRICHRDKMRAYRAEGRVA
jgi:hypothetical protein